MPKTLTIKMSTSPAITITRSAFHDRRLVYIAVANKPLRYTYGRSRIAYIGTTRVGASRIAASAAKRGLDVLQDHGVKQLQFYRVTSKPLAGVDSWAQLEVALLITFREIFGVVPRCNSLHKKSKSTKKPPYFTDKRLRSVIKRYTEAL